MKDDLIVLDKNIKIEDMIYEIRGKQVMLDSDLAKLYECKYGTKEVNQAVKNNLEKFPERFSWKLNGEEVNVLRSKILTANISNKSRSNPRVFTEQGVYMLATILKTSVATQVNIKIMDAFVNMRKYISNDSLFKENINIRVIDHENRIGLLEESLSKLSEKQKVNTVFFEGEIFDAYYLFMRILKDAKEEIIIIDNYAGIELLNILKEIDKKVIIVSKNITEEHVKKYKQQYNNLEFINNKSFHDRFIIIDKYKLYHCGASFKELGKKCFYIGEIDNKYIDNIINAIF